MASPSKTVVMLIMALMTQPRIRQFISAPKINGAKTAQEGGRLAFVAELDKFDVGENFRAAPISGKEKNGHHAAEALRPPQPVAGDSVFSYQAGDEQRGVGGEGGGHHRGAGQPPGNIASRYEKFFSGAAGFAAVVDADEQVEQQVGTNDQPVEMRKRHELPTDGWRSV